MRANRPMPALAALLAAAVALTACGGGGGGGGASNGDPTVEMVTASGLGVPLWQSGGTPVPGGSCAQPVALNSIIEFTFGGRVDPASLPGWAGWVPGAPVPGPTLAQGSINITATDGTTTTPATGSFAVVDDPSLPAGNGRKVRFLPSLPSNPTNPAATSGLSSATTFNVFLPRGGSGGQVVRVGGEPVQNEVLTCFFTCDTAMVGTPTLCFTDPVPGPPHIVSSIPAMTDPAGAAIDPAAIVDNTITLFFNEPLFPSNIDSTTIRLVNANSGAQVPGTVTFFQAGTPEAGPNFARVDYEASSQLLSSARYELIVDPSIQDFGSNGAVLYDPADPNAPASGRRFLDTIAVPFCEGTPFDEDFTTTTNRASTTGVAIWDGSGSLASEFPFDVVGDGTFGMLAVAAGSTTLDTDMPAAPGFANGVWNTTGVVIPAGAAVRLVGSTYQAHFRSQGTVTISGTLNGSAPPRAAGPTRPFPVGHPDQGAYNGQLNQGGAANAVVNGGVGGVGGGKGGDASQAGFTMRTEVAEGGLGPAFNGALNTGPFAANPTFGGGAGGDGDVRGLVPPTVDPAGGIGGAGGTAFTQGVNGQPRTDVGAGCTPLQSVQPISMATPVPAAFMAPISMQAAGSGGGGGGDRHEAGAATGDDQGGGGGGGGGGLRISSIQSININAGAIITMDGGSGGDGNILFGGCGGGGSGGQIWLQSFDRVIVAAGARLSANGGQSGLAGGTRDCGFQDAGDGGLGLVQLEDSQPALINMGFIGANPSNLRIVQFPFSTTIRGEAVSNWFDTGYGDPDFLAANEAFTIGNAPGAAVTITYEGAFESLGGGTPDPATISAPVSAANLDMIDGFRFVRFRVVMEYDPPMPGGGGSSPTDILPEVTSIQIRYATPLVCP